MNKKQRFYEIYEKFYIKPRETRNYDISFLQEEWKQKYKKGMFREVEIVGIELIRKCNLYCQMCSIVETKELGQNLKNMSFEDYKIVLNQLPKGIWIVPNGIGEAFLRDDIINILRYTKEQGFKTSINTNGIFFKLDALRYLDEVIFSLDSLEKKEAESIRKGLKFERVIDVIRDSLEFKRKKKLKTKISLNSVIIDQSLESIKKIFDFVQESGIDALSFSPPSNLFKYNSNRYFEFQNTYKNKKVDWDKIVELYMQGDFDFDFTIYYPNRRKGHCNFGFTQFYIDNDLNLSLCCVMPRDTIVGNLRENSFKELLESEKVREYQYSQLHLAPYPVCDNCCVGVCGE